MTDTKKLQGKMREKGFTISRLAEILGCSDTGLSNKIHNRTEFTISEVDKIGTVLGLTLEEKDAIFFAKAVE